MSSAFSCPKCETRIPLKHALWLTPSSAVKCRGCGRALLPQKMGKWWFAIGFWSVGITGQIAFYWKKPFVEALLICLLVSFIVYLASVFYTFKKIKFLVDENVVCEDEISR